VTFAAEWGADGGPHITVNDDELFDIERLPDDVVADLLDASLHTGDRPVGALVRRAAALRLRLDAERNEQANAVLVASSARAAADPGELTELDAWLVLTESLPAHHGRFVVQNLVLSLRAELVAWDADPERTGAAAALRRIAARLGVSIEPRT
jgi:hypothetical protein